MFDEEFELVSGVHAFPIKYFILCQRLHKIQILGSTLFLLVKNFLVK